MGDIEWKVWRISKCGGGRYGNAKKGDVWECSNKGGLVRKNGIILEAKPNEGKIMKGYLSLVDSGFRVHRIIAETWVLNENKEKNNYVDHIDGNILNNDADNLRWTTCSGNGMNPITRKKISDGKKGYIFTDNHKRNISNGNHDSFIKMNDKQRKIRFNSKIKGVYLRLNKETNKYDYYDSRYHGNLLTEEQVNNILYSFGYDNNMNKLK